MRAAVLHGPGDLRVEDVPDPVAGPGEVVLAVEVALTCATDGKMLRQGRHPALGPLPAALGHEVVGRVRATGRGVDSGLAGRRVVVANSAPCGQCGSCDTTGACGDRVYMNGAYAEMVRVPAAIVGSNLIALPDEVPAARAALTEPLACAVRGASRCGAGAGDTVLVLGAGVQGALITSVLAARGCHVVVSDPHPERLRRAVELGAAATIGAVRSPADADRRELPTGGPRYVVEAVGRIDVWDVAVSVAAREGEVTLYGGCAPGTSLTLDAGRLHYGELRVQGSYHHTPSSVREALAMLMNEPRYEILLADPVALDDVPAVLANGTDKHPVVM